MARVGIVAALVQLVGCSGGSAIDPSTDTSSASSGVVETFDTLESLDSFDPCDGDPCCGDPCCGDPCCGDPCCGDTTGGCCTDGGCDTEDTDDPPPCDGVDCGAGVCVLDENDAPYCECDEGHVAVGLTCLACTAVDTSYDIDVAVATVTVQPTLDGMAFPNTASQSAELALVGSAGDRVELGDTTVPELVASVIPGRYALVYSYVAGDVLPRNTAATIAWLDVAEDTAIAIDVASTALSGLIYVDGSVAPVSVTENGRISLRDGDDAIELAETRDGGFATRIIPGQYEIEYGWLAGGEVLPANPRATIAVVEVPHGEVQFDVDIPTVAVSGAFAIAGEVPPASDLENGRISFVGTHADDIIELGETRYGSFARRLVPGEYSVIYEHVAGGAYVPINSRAALGSIDVFDSTAVDVDVPMVAISGTFTLGGAAPPPAEGSDGTIVLSTAAGDLVDLGSMSTGSYAANVVAGAYDVQYRVQQVDDDVYPRNDATTIAQVAVDGGAPIDIDVPVVNVSGEVTIDGAPPPVMGDGGTILLRDQGTAQTFVIAPPGAPTFSASIIPGNYDLMYAADEVAVVAPVNTLALIGSLTVDTDLAVAIDVPVRAPSGSIAVDGAQPEADALGELVIEDIAIAETAMLLAAVADGSYSTRVTPGSYLLRYRATSSTAVPMNTYAPLACIAIE